MSRNYRIVATPEYRDGWDRVFARCVICGRLLSDEAGCVAVGGHAVSGGIGEAEPNQSRK